ncbi:YihY/virulence factor BrkB family protein [Phenylobacterium sp.]|uniref:YihY/virulence factor BrkB family protein n=1 Tax=Phenylobacterium sp. TaxID=1871053 RepID=UPI0034237AA0
MSIHQELGRLGMRRWEPLRAARLGLSTVGRALTRLWGRDVMLYVGGTSFFIMLAIFPAVALLIGAYSLLADPAQAEFQAEALARLMPTGARDLFQAELERLARAPRDAISAQSGVALVIGAYAAHRGFKALLAGLSFIHDEPDPRGFVGFNLMALIVLLAAAAMMGIVSSMFLGLRVAAATLDLRPLAGVSWLYSEWTWASAGLTLGMSLIYRYAMSRRTVAWAAAVCGGFVAAILCLFASWASAFYVEQIAHLGATYGSITAVVVFLIWLSWSVNAVFFGGALATEIEIRLDEHRRQALLADLRPKSPQLPSRPEN